MSIITYTKTRIDTLLALRLLASANLSDLQNVVTARTNLGLGTAATQNKVAAGAAGVLDATDPTTTNSRTPLAHASSHAAAGSDPISITAAQIASGVFSTARIPDLDAAKIISGTFAAARIPNLDAAKIASGIVAVARLGTGTPSSSNYLRGDGAWTTPPAGVPGGLKAATADLAAINATVVFGTTPYYARVTEPGTWSISKLGFVQNSASAFNIELAVFHDNGSDAPGTLVSTTGSAAQTSTTGIKLVNLSGSITAQKGDWFGLVLSTPINLYTVGVSAISRPLWLARIGTGVVAPGSMASNPSVSSTPATQSPTLWGE